MVVSVWKVVGLVVMSVVTATMLDCSVVAGFCIDEPVVSAVEDIYFEVV